MGRACSVVYRCAISFLRCRFSVEELGYIRAGSPVRPLRDRHGRGPNFFTHGRRGNILLHEECCEWSATTAVDDRLLCSAKNSRRCGWNQNVAQCCTVGCAQVRGSSAQACRRCVDIGGRTRKNDFCLYPSSVKLGDKEKHRTWRPVCILLGDSTVKK